MDLKRFVAPFSPPTTTLIDSLRYWTEQQPQEVAYFVPGAPKLSPAGAIQLNDVYVDDRGLVFTVDRFAGGLYTLEMTV